MNLVEVKISLYNATWRFSRPAMDNHRGFYIRSRAKICPYCLSIWAKILVGSPPYGVEMHCCEHCEGRDNPEVVPGSLLDDRVSWTVDLDLLDYLPYELVAREYRLHLKHLERSTSEQPATLPTLVRDLGSFTSPRSECST